MTQRKSTIEIVEGYRKEIGDLKEKVELLEKEKEDIGLLRSFIRSQHLTKEWESFTGEEKKEKNTCPVCKGSGEVQQTDVDWDDCRRCNGTGYIEG